jgi:hypothetical protein
MAAPWFEVGCGWLRSVALVVLKWGIWDSRAPGGLVYFSAILSAVFAEGQPGRDLASNSNINGTSSLEEIRKVRLNILRWDCNLIPC